MRDEDQLQVDFMGRIDGIRSFESVRDKATLFVFGGYKLAVANLRDIAYTQYAAGLVNAEVRTRLRLSRHRASGFKSEQALIDAIRRRLALPAEERTNFLEKRIGYRLSGRAL